MNKKQIIKNNKLISKKLDKVFKLTLKMNKKLIKLLETAKEGKHISYDKDFSYLDMSSISELIKYTNLIISKNFKSAENIQTNMDSSVRDSIPEEIYSIIEWIVYPPNDNMTIHEAFSRPYSKSGMGV